MIRGICRGRGGGDNVSLNSRGVGALRPRDKHERVQRGRLL